MRMNLKNLNYPNYFRAVWCLLGACLLWQLGATMTQSSFLPRRVRKTLVQYKETTEKAKQADPSETKQPEVPNNMFAPPRHPAELTCTAILGDEALINGRWYKVGSEVKGAKVIEINPASVKILQQEREKELVPFNVPVVYADNKPQPSNGQPPTKTEPQAQDEISESTPAPPVMRGPGGFQMTDEMRQMRERYLNASPEEQAEMRRQMRERFGGRRRPRRDRQQ